MTQLIARFSLFSPYVQCSLRTVTLRTEGKEREWQVVESSRDNATKMIHLIFMGHTTGFGDNYTFYCILICFENLMKIDNVWSWYDDMMIRVFTCIYIHIFIFVHIWYILLLSFSMSYSIQVFPLPACQECSSRVC